MKIEHTSFALKHLNAVRRKGKEATWVDVANAYDAGLAHGSNAAARQRIQIARYLLALRLVNASNGVRIP